MNKAIAQIPSTTGLPEKIGNYAIEIKLNDSHFTDRASDEIITFSLGVGSPQNREHRLRLNIGLSEKKQLCVWMECDQKQTEQMQIAPQSQLMNPTLLGMQLDTISNRCQDTTSICGGLERRNHFEAQQENCPGSCGDHLPTRTF